MKDACYIPLEFSTVCFTLIMYRTYYVNLALKHQTSQLSQSDQNENGKYRFYLLRTASDRLHLLYD